MDKKSQKNLNKYLEASRLEIFGQAGGSLWRSQDTKKGHDYTQDFQLGGQGGYFDNLFRGVYRRDDRRSERCWKFILKHIIVADRIFSQGKKGTVAVADVGCGPGYLGRILAANRQKEKIIYAGVDLNINKLVQARDEIGDHKNNFFWIWHNATKPLPLISASYDFAISFQMIKYLDKNESGRLIREMFRILKKGGMIYVSTDPFGKECESPAVKNVFRKKGYRSFWQEKEFISILARAGFTGVSVYGAEGDWDKLKTKIAGKGGKDVVKRLVKIFPEEILEAFLGFLYPEISPTKLFIARKP